MILWDEYEQVIGIAHAGWQGVLDDIVAETADMIEEYGGRNYRFKAHIGPSIRACCYDIFGDRQRLFEEKFPAHSSEIIHEHDGEHTLDLVACVRLQLREVGVTDERITIHPDCTSCRAEKYDSYHRDGKTYTQLISSVWIE